MARVWLVVEGERILRASYQTYGCFAAIASGEMLCLAITGKTIPQACQLTPHDIYKALQGLPEGKEHCPQLAVQALQNAIGVSGSIEARDPLSAIHAREIF